MWELYLDGKKAGEYQTSQEAKNAVKKSRAKNAEFRYVPAFAEAEPGAKPSAPELDIKSRK
jgi:hypothetical protein